MTIKIYDSYGVLAHEKQPVYTIACPASEIYDVITVELPDEIIVGRNEIGDLLLDLDGCIYLLDEALGAWNGKPALRWHDGRRNRCRILRVVG